MSEFIPHSDDNRIKVESILFNQDMIALFNRIIDQNAQIIELNNKILNAFELPAFSSIIDNNELKKFLRK